MLEVNILITNVSYHNAVSAIKMCRCLEDVFIIGNSKVPYGFSSGSLLVDQFINTTDIDDGECYISQIIKICTDYDVELIISTEDEEQKLFNKYSDYFEDKIITVDNDLIDLFTNKQNASISVSSIGVDIPHIYNEKEIKQIKNKDIIIRENVSCCSYGIKILTNTNGEEINKNLSASSFAQAYIKGDEYTVDVLCDKYGSPKNIIPRKRIAIRNGITYKCIIEKNELLINACKKLYSHFCIPGFSNTQFIIKNGVAYFIETNLRIGGTTIASNLAGNNLMEIYIEHFFKNQPMKKSKIKWGSVITRYYSETIFIPENKYERHYS